MRMAFGLVAILVTLMVVIFIMKFMYLPSLQQAASVQKNVRPKVEQIAGQDPATGGDARDSIKLDAENGGGSKMKSVAVTQLVPGGAMEKYFGLQKGDSIVEIGTQGGVMTAVKDMASPGEAKDNLLSSCQNSQQIVVIRNGQRVTLPAAAPAPAGNSAQQQVQNIKIPGQ